MEVEVELVDNMRQFGVVAINLSDLIRTGKA